jgi:hypothetical protein
MIVYAFDFGLWTILFFVVGMINPRWALFFLEKPSRFLILIITTVFVMITFTLYGEGARRDKLAQNVKVAPKSADVSTAPVPVPVPVPTPDKPAVAK